MEKGYVYCLLDEQLGICRIGMSSSNTYERVKGQMAYYPNELKLNKLHVDDPLGTEQYLHKLFKPFRVKASWYKITPDLFFKYAKEYSSKFVLSVMHWVSDPVQRGVKIWIISIDGVEHMIEESEESRHNRKRKIFRKNGKSFYVNFKDEYGYYSVRAGNKQKVIVTNLSKTKKIKEAVLYWKDVDNCDPLVKEYIAAYERKDKGQQKFESYRMKKN